MDNKGPLTLMTSCMTHPQCACFLADQSAKCQFGDTRVVYESHNPQNVNTEGTAPPSTPQNSLSVTVCFGCKTICTSI